MEFKPGDLVFVVCPFLFHIYSIMIKDTIDTYYVDTDNAYYEESTVFASIQEAKEAAREKLDAFYFEKIQIIESYRGIE